jgi:hypothetical protein
MFARQRWHGPEAPVADITISLKLKKMDRGTRKAIQTRDQDMFCSKKIALQLHADLTVSTLHAKTYVQTARPGSN